MNFWEDVKMVCTMFHGKVVKANLTPNEAKWEEYNDNQEKEDC